MDQSEHSLLSKYLEAERDFALITKKYQPSFHEMQLKLKSQLAEAA